jgi:hypothetical protein
MQAIDPRLKDFRNFLYIVWKHLHLPDPTPIQYDIASSIQNGPKRQVVEAFRGVGKSWVTSAFVVHQLLLDPSLNFLVVSASKSRADDFSTFTLRLIQEIPILQHLMPGENQRSSKIAFDVGPAPAAHAPSVKSVGITGQITGSRADVVIADDVESLNNSLTQGMRDRLSETIKEFEAVLKPNGRILFLGTPQSEMSIYNVLPDRGYEVQIWPARYPGKHHLSGYGNRLAPLISEGLKNDASLENKPTDGNRFCEDDLLERELSYGKTGFALQFMLDTRLSDVDRYPLKLSDLVVMALNPELGPAKAVWASSPELAWNDLPCVGLSGDRYYRPMQTIGEWSPYTGSVMAIDPSGRGKDETGYAIVKMLNGQLFLTASGGFREGYKTENLEALANVAKSQKVNYIIVESNFGDGMFTQLLKPVLGKIHPCTVEEVRHSQQKERRIIDTLEPVLNQHRLIVDAKVIDQDYKSTSMLSSDTRAQYQLFYQLSRLTKDRGSLSRDDRLDSLSMAVGYWVEQMARDVDIAVKEARAEKIDKELNKFMDSIFKLQGKKKQTTWMKV